MRRVAAALGLLVLLLGVAALVLQRVPPRSAFWNAGRGELRITGHTPCWVLRHGWSRVEGARVSTTAQARSSDGVTVEVHAVVAFPPGTSSLAPGTTPAEGLRTVLEAAARPATSSASAGCLAGVEGRECFDRSQAVVASAVASRLGLPSGAVAIDLVPDGEVAKAARLRELRQRIGPVPRRVLVVGWDGADWEVLEPLARRGVMPTLAALMAAGSHGRLSSFTPLLSPLIWTTMATGVGPEVHGILDFMEVDPTSGEKVQITGRQRKVPALWNMASAAGRTVAVSGWWATWPAEKVAGVLASDRLFNLLADTVADAPEGTVVYPPEREAECRELARRAEVETDETVIRALMPVSSHQFRIARERREGMADPVDGFRRIVVGTRIYFGTAVSLAAAKPDLEMVYGIGTDEVGHLLAPLLPPPLPGTDAAMAAAAETAVARYFGVVDRWLGRLLAACPLDECAVLLVSDHGFKWGADRPREHAGPAAATASLWHRPTGVWVLAGKGVTRLGRTDAPASVFDVAPTVAALLGLPPGEGFTGKPLPGCPPPAGAPVDWTALVPPSSYRREGGAAGPSEEAVAQLRSLGYLEGAEGLGRGRTATEGELNNLGLVHLEARRHAEAEQAFRDAIARNPAYASPHYNLRRLYFETSQWDEADTELWRAVELKLRDGVGAVDRAATDYQKAGQVERALALLAEAGRRFPEEARLALHHVSALMQVGRCPEAAEVGAAAAGRLPNEPHVQAFLGLAAACAGDERTARAAFERSLELDPDQPEIRQALEALGSRATGRR